jgi:hypothetical protein
MNPIIIPLIGDLPPREEITLAYDKILVSAQELRCHVQRLTSRAREIQNSCTHADCTLSKRTIDGYPGVFEQNNVEILDAKKCNICNLTTARPKGGPHAVCHKCWGKMKHDGFIPGQGGGIHVYQCEQCGHEVCAT